jgi:hypothetical protein
MMRRVIAVSAAALIAAVTAACGPTATPLPSALSSAAASDGAAGAVCPEVRERGPDGSIVDLTGTWRGFDSGLLFVTQTLSCVAIEGLSNYPNEPLGTSWRSVFTGDLTSEFTVVGRWTWTRQVFVARAATGETFALTMPIDFDDQNQPVIQIALQDVGYTNSSDPDLGPAETLERISLSTAYPD